MRYSGFMAAVAIGVCAAIAPAAAGQEELSRGEKIERLREDHREWIEQEVVYIITEREEDVFLSLETLEERNRFIEVFWKNGIPIRRPRRTSSATSTIGASSTRTSTSAGTPFGRAGAPTAAATTSFSANLGSGIPSTATTKWFRANSGSTRAMSRRDCLRSSISSSSSDTTSGSTACTTRWWTGRNRWSAASITQGGGPEGNIRAYEALQRIDVELANASLSLDPSEPGDWTSGRASLAATS